MTAFSPHRLLTTVREQQRSRLSASRAAGILCGLALCALCGPLFAADDVAPWMKPLLWANPASSNSETAPPPLPSPSEMTVFEPLRFRGDRKVPRRADEYTANEPDFETVQQPFAWENPQAAHPEPEPKTDAERIEYEKRHFAWIRPFYWDDSHEARLSMPLRQEYVGTPDQQLPVSDSWRKPFMWSNAAPSYPWGRTAAATPADPALLADSARGLYRLPPVDGAQTVAFMYQESTLPAPEQEEQENKLPPGFPITEEVTEPETPAADPAPATDPEDITDRLPFQDVNQDGVLDSGDLSHEGVEKDKGVLGEAEKLGEEPEDNYSLQFLRADTVLLKPGDCQCDYGFAYTLFDTPIPAVNSSLNLETARVRQRQLIMPLEIRYGLARRLQLFANMPFGWSNIEVSLSDFERFENDGGQGDLTFGGSFLVRQANECQSDLVWTCACTAPTGIGSPILPVGQSTVPTLGNGVWSLSSNLLWIKTYDPLVMFYGVGTRQSFTTDIAGFSFRPGQEYNYQMGIGFAVNSKVTLSTRFNGAYITEPRLDGTRFLGTIQEPMSISLATTIARCNGLVEPFVDFGLTDESVESSFGVTWTRY